LCAATAALVFFRAIQQLNVVHHRYLWAVITPFGVAVSEVSVLLYVVGHGWSSAPWMGAGGAVGAVAAMAAHKWMRAHAGR